MSDLGQILNRLIKQLNNEISERREELVVAQREYAYALILNEAEGQGDPLGDTYVSLEEAREEFELALKRLKQSQLVATRAQTLMSEQPTKESDELAKMLTELLFPDE